MRSRLRPEPRPSRRPGGPLLAMLLALPLLAAASPRDDAPPSVEPVRDKVARYVEARKAIAAERLAFAQSKESLESRVEMLATETAGIEQRIEEAASSLATADRLQQELLDRSAALRSASELLAGEVAGLERRVEALLPRLPDPIRERVKPLSQRIPQDPAASKLSIGDRFLSVVGILNEIDKFNGEITLASEVRSLPDGGQAEVTVLYLGVGQGYYVNSTGTIAGIGTAGPDAWSWRPANQAAAAIAMAVSVLQGEMPPQFVRLPIRID
jgi:hypothetical protein